MSAFAAPVASNSSFPRCGSECWRPKGQEYVSSFHPAIQQARDNGVDASRTSGINQLDFK